VGDGPIGSLGSHEDGSDDKKHAGVMGVYGEMKGQYERVRLLKLDSFRCSTCPSGHSSSPAALLSVGAYQTCDEQYDDIAFARLLALLGVGCVLCVVPLDLPLWGSLALITSSRRLLYEQLSGILDRGGGRAVNSTSMVDDQAFAQKSWS
jgi:hypothetical protein